jgi:hypothetical protein
MFKKKLSEWSMLPAEVEVTHFYGNFRNKVRAGCATLEAETDSLKIKKFMKDPDPTLPSKSDPGPKKIIPNQQHSVPGYQKTHMSAEKSMSTYLEFIVTSFQAS